MQINLQPVPMVVLAHVVFDSCILMEVSTSLLNINFGIDHNHLLTKQAGNIAGVAVGMKNWLRVTIAIEPSSLKEGLGRIEAFYRRHAKEQ